MRSHITKWLVVASLFTLTLFLVPSCQKRLATSSNPQLSSPTPIASNTPAAQATPVEVKIYHGSGIVTKVVRENPYDKSLASVELDHGEIAGLMPAMRMEFYVKDKSLLDGLNVGDLVDFTIEEKASTEIISEIKKK